MTPHEKHPGFDRDDAICVALLVAFVVVLFRHALFEGKLMLIGDPLRQLYPLRTMAWESIRQGSLPLVSRRRRRAREIPRSRTHG